MRFRKYTFKCFDTNDNYLFDIFFTFPVYTVEEYNSFWNTYNDKYASGDHVIIMGKGNSLGSLTEYGSFLLNTMGLKYTAIPYTLPSASDFNRVWFSVLIPYFPYQYDFTSNVLKIPITGGNNYRDYRDFKISSDSASCNAMGQSWKQNSDRFRPTEINGEDGFKSTWIGSASGSNLDNAQYAEVRSYFLVEDGRLGIVGGSGWYDGSASQINLKQYITEASSNPSFNSWFNKIILNNEDYEEVDPTVTDPFNPGGNSGTGGGTGNFDGTSDSIDFPPLPTLSAVDTGFITLFNPSLSEMKNLANYMWSDLFDIATWKKLFADPMDAILGLSIVPVAIPDGGQKIVTVGNVSTGISMNIAQSQFVEVDCGTLNVNEYWGAYLDYSPYTEAELYLPYIGIHALKTDDIMGKAVHIKYHIDILSGACCAYVKCGNSVLYEFVGQGSCSIPITGNDWTNVINGALTIGASIGTMMATGGATAPMISSVASAAVNSLKPTVERSGSVSGMGGVLGIQKPYLVLTRPRQALPKNQNLYMGYPSFITSRLGDLSGYTEVEALHLENIPATEEEIDEIDNLLKDGVIF